MLFDPFLEKYRPLVVFYIIKKERIAFNLTILNYLLSYFKEISYTSVFVEISLYIYLTVIEKN